MSNGKFTIGNKKAANRKSKVTKSIYNKVETVAISERKITDHLNKDYLPFGDNNLFPQEQAELNRKSPVSRAIVNSKKDYIVGRGYQTENPFFMNYRPNKNQTMFDLTNNMAIDRLYGGNEWLEIIHLGNAALMNHIDGTKVRYSLDRKNILVHPDWEKYNSNKKLTTVYPIYPEFAKIEGLNGSRSIIHLADYEPSFGSYGIPSNIAGNDSAEINYKTNRWNNNRIENSFQVSGLLQIFADLNDEDAKDLSEDITNVFVGHENAGKPLQLISPVTGERNDTKWIPFNEQMDGHWTLLHDQAVKELCTANQWFPLLSGIPISTGFDVGRLRQEYQIALNGIIAKEQQKFIQLWQMLFKDLFSEDLEDLAFINKNPFTDTDLINFDDALSKNEKRKMLGFDPVDEEGIKASLNGTQVSSMVDVVRSVTAGEISKAAGIQILIISYGLTEDQAKEFFK